MTDTKKLSKSELNKQISRDRLSAFLTARLSARKVAKKTADLVIADIINRVTDDSSVPTLLDSPDILIVKHPHTPSRVSVRQDLKKKSKA